MVSSVVDFTYERKKRRSNVEAVAEILPLADGGIAVVTEVDGVEITWEFDRDQAVILIQALVQVFKTRESVTLVQPRGSAA